MIIRGFTILTLLAGMFVFISCMPQNSCVNYKRPQYDHDKPANSYHDIKRKLNSGKGNNTVLLEKTNYKDYFNNGSSQRNIHSKKDIVPSRTLDLKRDVNRIHFHTKQDSINR